MQKSLSSRHLDFASALVALFDNHLVLEPFLVEGNLSLELLGHLLL